MLFTLIAHQYRAECDPVYGIVSVSVVPLLTVVRLSVGVPHLDVVAVPPFHAATDADSVQFGTDFVDQAVRVMWCDEFALDCLTQPFVPFVTLA